MMPPCILIRSSASAHSDRPGRCVGAYQGRDTATPPPTNPFVDVGPHHVRPHPRIGSRKGSLKRRQRSACDGGQESSYRIVDRHGTACLLRQRTSLGHPDAAAMLCPFMLEHWGKGVASMPARICASVRMPNRVTILRPLLGPVHLAKPVSVKRLRIPTICAFTVAGLPALTDMAIFRCPAQCERVTVVGTTRIGSGGARQIGMEPVATPAPRPLWA